MLSLVVRRVVRLVVVLAGVSLVTFAILQVSGDPVALMMPEAPEADRAALRQSMGFNQPLPVQFARFVGNIARGDFGQSFFHREPALPLVLARIPTTLLLTVLALGLSLLVALPLGVLSAVRRNSIFDHGATFAVFLGTSMPVFWTGIMLILLFAVQFRWLPVSGWESWSALVLPALTLASASTPLLLRIVRSSMLEVVNLDYVRTARAKGVSEWLVIWHHALVNAALPLVTVAGLQFGLPARGRHHHGDRVRGAGAGAAHRGRHRQLDFPIVQAGVFVLALIVVLVNFTVDLLYVYLNPQIRVR
jgi:ABC-type dipeptide/oligopeptide/nickel transport system permease component